MSKPKLRWNKRGNDWVLLDDYDSVLATVEHCGWAWIFEGYEYDTLAYAKRATITKLVMRGEL